MPVRFTAEKVIYLRLSKGLSRDALGRRAGISRQAVRLIERGDVVPRPETVLALADALGVPVGDLYATEAVA